MEWLNSIPDTVWEGVRRKHNRIGYCMRRQNKPFEVARIEEEEREEREKRETKKESASSRTGDQAFSFFGCEPGRKVREKDGGSEGLVIEIARGSSPETVRPVKETPRPRAEVAKTARGSSPETVRAASVRRPEARASGSASRRREETTESSSESSEGSPSPAREPKKKKKVKKSTGRMKRSGTKKSTSSFGMADMLQIVRATASTTANEVRKAIRKEREVELERIQGRVEKKRKRKE